jgi:predicted Zn-dependent protease
VSAPGHELVERALASSVSDDCVVILQERSSANLRWATNTLTTNGEMRDRSLTAIAFRRTSKGVAAASVTGSAADPDRVLAVVGAADAAAARAGPAEDAAELVADRSSADWADPPEGTSIGVFADFAPSLGEAFVRARAERRVLYGFVEHRVATTYLGSTTGLRLRHVQPTGHYACTGKTGDLSASAWTCRRDATTRSCLPRRWRT